MPSLSGTRLDLGAMVFVEPGAGVLRKCRWSAKNGSERRLRAGRGRLTLAADRFSGEKTPSFRDNAADDRQSRGLPVPSAGQ